MAIGERIRFIRNLRGMTQNISVLWSVFQRRPLISAWLNMRLAHAPRRRI